MLKIINNTPESVKVVGDIAAGSTTIAALLGYLPAIAAAVSIIYGLLRIYEWFELRNKRK